MIVNIAKSLDRPVDIFGIRGGWIRTFLIMAGACVLAGVVAGSCMSAGVGVSVAIVGVLVCFVACQALQGSVSHRHLEKQPLSGRMKCYVRRKETLSSVLLPDPRYEAFKRIKESKAKM